MATKRSTNARRATIVIAAAILVTMGVNRSMAQRKASPVLVNRPETAPAIYTPRPKRETLDESGDSSNTAKLETVLTVNGDRLVGKIIGIEAGGKLLLTAPQFQGEVSLLVSALDRVSLPSEHEEPGRDGVTLTNEDYVVGRITGITPDTVVIETGAAGTVRVLRKVVRSVSFSKDRSVLVDSTFDSGDMAPWKVARGNWSVSDGHLTSSSSGRRETVFAVVKQDEPVTVEVKVEALSGHNLNCDLVLFADDTRSSYGRNSVYIMFQSSSYYMCYARNGGTTHMTSRHIGRSIRFGVLRLTYDPETRKAKVWLNNDPLGEHAVPTDLKRGQYVMFSSRYPCKVDYIRVLRGAVPPSRGAAGKGETDKDIVEFDNKDRVSAELVSLADGEFVALTEHGELRPPVGNVRSVVFRTEGQAKPRRRKGDVEVKTPGSRMTVQFEKLTDEYLIGSSETLGKVKILRSAIRQIRFNVYR